MEIEEDNDKFVMGKDPEEENMDYAEEVELKGSNAKGITVYVPTEVYIKKAPEDYLKIKSYCVEVPHNMIYRLETCQPNELLAMFIMLNLKNCKCILPCHKPPLPYRYLTNPKTGQEEKVYEYNTYETRVIEGVMVNSMTCPGYRKLLYKDYKYKETEFYGFPVFFLSDEIYPLAYRRKPNREILLKDFKEHFHYIGDGKFALIERTDYETKSQKIAEKELAALGLCSLRYKRTYEEFYNGFCQTGGEEEDISYVEAEDEAGLLPSVREVSV